MPHQCVKCGTFYDDGASEIIKGCECGARLFFFIRKERMKKAQEEVQKLTPKDKSQIEKDVLELVGADTIPDQPVVLDFESISVKKPGKYELDLVNLFKKGQPTVYKLADGKYVIDLPETFKKLSERED